MYSIRKISDLKKLPNNPRIIKDDQFKKLVKSIKDNKEYFKARPLILSDRTGELIIIAGNQRYEAAITLNMDEVPTYLLHNLTEEKEKEVIIRDNISNGAWDWAELANNWDKDILIEWGFDEYMFGIQIDDADNADEDTEPPKEKKQHKCPECGCEFQD